MHFNSADHLIDSLRFYFPLDIETGHFSEFFPANYLARYWENQT